MRRFSAEALLLGSVASAVIVLLQAPIWTFSLVGFLSWPWLAVRLPQMDPDEPLPTERLVSLVRRLRHSGR